VALIAMASYCTPENKRFPLTLRTLDALYRTVDWTKHRLVVIDNGSTCPAAVRFFDEAGRLGGLVSWSWKMLPPYTLIRNADNRGQARALNQGWLLRDPGEVLCRLDDDVDLLDDGWLDRLCDCLDRDPTLGVVGLKRPDLWERPDHPDAAWRSELVMLPHEPGQDWLVVEKAKSVIGTVQAVSHRLVDKIGYLYQGSFKWGLEDADMVARAGAAGFWCGFWPHARIRHLDPTPSGGSDYQRWKESQGDAHHAEFNKRRDGYRDGTVPLYHGPDDE
jgi:O-antigen biosynthesis protein